MGILSAAVPSTGVPAPAPVAAVPAPAPAPIQAPPVRPNTLDMGLPQNAPNPLNTSPQAGNNSLLHNNEAINAALMNAFHPIVPDNSSILGPAMAHLLGQSLPISYYQPRQVAQIEHKK